MPSDLDYTHSKSTDTHGRPDAFVYCSDACPSVLAFFVDAGGTVQGEVQSDEMVLLKDIQDCQLVDVKGKTWGLCFQVTEKDVNERTR